MTGLNAFSIGVITISAWCVGVCSFMITLYIRDIRNAICK